MAVTASRLTSTGALLTRGEFDEVTKTTLNLTMTNQYAALFDEVTFNTTSPVIKNLLVVTEDFSQWASSNVVTTNQTVAPNGTLTADRIQATTGDYTALLDNPTVGGASYTFSLFVKSVSGASGTWGVNYYNGAHNRTTVPITGEWTRQYITFTGTGGPVNVYAADNRSNLATITDAYVWGAQLERGTTPTIYQGIGATNTLVPPGFAKRETSNGHIYVTDIFDEVTLAPGPTGQQAYITPGTFSWTAPAGVYSVSVVCIGGGAGAGTPNYGGGGGGGLGWKNNISVNPGQTYTVVVGAGGASQSFYSPYPQLTPTPGGDSYFINATTVKGGGAAGSTGGTYVGDGGGNGGNAFGSNFNNVSGAGAGGYSGNGADGIAWPGTFSSGNAGSGGGGGSGGLSQSGTYNSAGGGGVGILGEGTSGAAGVGTFSQCFGGAGGSGGTSGDSYGNGGGYGGGGGKISNYNVSMGSGAGGAVRIIWGDGRAFPSTGTVDL